MRLEALFLLAGTLFLIAAGAVSCTRISEAQTEQKYDPVMQLSRSTSVYDVRLEDGTRCVVVKKLSGNGGVGIDCDFQ